MSAPLHTEHDAPLWWLVKTKLHAGRTLADNVRRLRFKRRKAASAVVPAANPLDATEPLTKEAL